MPNTIINRKVVFGGIKYDADALTYFSYLTTPPSSARKQIINNLVLTLKANSNWALLDRLWLLASESQQASTISLVNPSSTAITEVNSPTWTLDQGYTGNGSTSYLDSNFNKSSQGVNYTLNVASFGVYCRTNIAAPTDEMGTFDGTNGAQLLTRSTASIVARINTSAGLIVDAIPDSLGLTAISRVDASNIMSYKNGSLINTTAGAASAIPNLVTFICALNLSSVASVHSAKQLSMAFAGSGTINQATFYTAIQNYMTALGTQV